MLNVGFVEIEVGGRRSVGLDDLVRYPLFAPDFIAFLRRVMPVDRHAELVFSIVVTARKPRRSGSADGAERSRQVS
jgi:hypothetical protein